MKSGSSVEQSQEFYQSLEFDLARAVLLDLATLLGQMKPVPLIERNLSLVEEEQGVYELFFRGELVYVGKTDAEAGLNSRLRRHSRKISSRLNLSPSDVSFRAVRIFVFTPLDLETGLIKKYQEAKTVLTWNKSGFGSNDPGRRRDGTKLKDGHFDRLYPINLDIDLGLESPFIGTIDELLQQIKDRVDYTVRREALAQSSRKPHLDLIETTVGAEKGATIRMALKRIASSLAHPWQVTAFPGCVTVYKKTEYFDHGEVIR